MNLQKQKLFFFVQCFGEQFAETIFDWPHMYCKIRTAQRTIQDSPFRHEAITTNYTMHYKYDNFLGLFIAF